MRRAAAAAGLVMPERVGAFPPLRFMGSKVRLLPWLHRVFSGLEFETALDAFSGSGSVSYLLKAMGKSVHANDHLAFSHTVARAVIENSRITLEEGDLERLAAYDPRHPHFMERTFAGIFFTPEELRFLDRVSWNARKFGDPHRRALAMAALIRASAKRQPRGVFTVASAAGRAAPRRGYEDGRRDLRLTLPELFREQVAAYNRAVFDGGGAARATRCDVFRLPLRRYDLVYLDPPYVPRADDNCYIKRYHFLEGLARHWRGVSLARESKVRKMAKIYTPFSYRRTALEAFERLMGRFPGSTLVLSYSSNGYPELEVLVTLMKRRRGKVTVHERDHRYHFGTHARAVRTRVTEYLIVAEPA